MTLKTNCVIFVAMSNDENYIKGRGAQINPANPYHKVIYDKNPFPDADDERKIATQFINVQAKTIINKVKSPDIPGAYSMNPYQGCEHGCVYCYARNTHPYWGYSAGLDFEQKILIKHDAPKLLRKRLQSKNWVVSPIMFSGNTDCYQPAEKKFELTRKMLEILWEFRHPVSMITKNSLILRDLDIFKKMAAHDLVHVSITLTTLNEDLRSRLEPRTATAAQRLKTIETLAAEGIPVNVMMAPIIPGLNDHEILKMAETVSQLGADSIAHTVVRLDGDIAEIFTDWLERNFPDRKDKVLNKIRSCHAGELGDNRYGKRMSGDGQIAAMISAQMKLARQRFFQNKKLHPYNLDLYEQRRNPQMKLF